MPKIPFRYIVSFSSQDPRHPAENILQGDGTECWLSCPKDRTGLLEGVVQLDRMCHISNVDIGACLVFSVQIQVGRSSWPTGQRYVTLLPTTTLMTPQECRKEKHKVTLHMFRKEHFCKETVIEKWDRVKVICNQPFRKDVQIGLSLLRIANDDDSNKSPESGSSQKEAIVDSLIRGTKVSQKPLSSGAAIHRHFFGSNATRDPHNAQLRSSLTKIAATVENGSVDEASMSRNVRLVLAANSSTPKYKRSEATNSQGSKTLLQKRTITFEEDVKLFLAKIDVKKLDVENLTFADLRHKFEKQKLRKLSKEERKVFFRKAQVFIEKALAWGEEKEVPINKATSMSSRSNNMYSLPRKVGAIIHQNVGNAIPSDTTSKTSGIGFHPGRPCMINQISTPNKTVLHSRISTDNQYSGNKRKLLSPDTPQTKRIVPDAYSSPTVKTPKHNKKAEVSMNTWLSKHSPLINGPVSASKRQERSVERSRVTPGHSDFSTPKGRERSVERSRVTPGSSAVSTSKGPERSVERSRVTPGSSAVSTSNGPERSVERSRVTPGSSVGNTVTTSDSPTGGGRGSAEGARIGGRGRQASTPSPVDLIEDDAGVPGYVSCPLCNGMYPASVVQAHASCCGIDLTNETSTLDKLPDDDDDDLGQCPICSHSYPLQQLIRHAEVCATTMTFVH